MADEKVIVDRNALERLMNRATNAEEYINTELGETANGCTEAVDDVVSSAEPFDGTVHAIVGHDIDPYNTGPTGTAFLSETEAEKRAWDLENAEDWAAAHTRELEVK